MIDRLALSLTHYQILRFISAGGPSTRTDLGTRTGLSKAAMSGLTRELIELSLLEEVSTVKRQGRPSTLLDLDPHGAYFVGVSLMSEPPTMALVNFRGRIVAQVEVAFDAEPERFATALAEALPSLLAKAHVERSRVAGMGVTVPGLVDHEQSSVIKSTLLGWEDVPLASFVHARTHLPTFIENDAKALAVSERLFGVARDMHSFCLIWLGKGIGAAHFVHDRLHRGAHGGAGEIAHSTIDTHGLPCRCGKVGCLDTVASMIAILDAAHGSGIKAQTLGDIEEAAASGSQAAVRLLHKAGSALGLAIAQIIQINDPQMIVLKHREDRFNGLFATVVRQTVEANVLPRLSGVTPLEARRVEDADWALGAASVATHCFLNGLI